MNLIKIGKVRINVEKSYEPRLENTNYSACSQLSCKNNTLCIGRDFSLHVLLLCPLVDSCCLVNNPLQTSWLCTPIIIILKVSTMSPCGNVDRFSFFKHSMYGSVDTSIVGHL